SKEALEAAAEPGDLSEWADMQFLLWDAQRRAGISDEQITQAMVEKLAVNKQREWPEPKDGEPRLHIKKSGNSPVTPDTWILVSERMPEQDGNYWGWWSESKRQGPVWFIKSELQAQFQSSEITHWMPLPAAPQQEVKP
ncbi:dATP/dGTP pyrophosphohydrolase domain-containing protein, partial [Salmonella enterica subsp. enterica serovar Bredeney]